MINYLLYKKLRFCSKPVSANLFDFLGCPEYGYYGEDCSIPCRDPHCRYCHRESGTCQRCEPGYYGSHCEHGILCVFKVPHELFWMEIILNNIQTTTRFHFFRLSSIIKKRHLNICKSFFMHINICWSDKSPPLILCLSCAE